MTLYKKYLFFFLLLVSFTSCEKVINVNINDAAPVFVIEGNVGNRRDSMSVTVSATSNITGEAVYLPVDSATVTISENYGTPMRIPLRRNGHYYLPRAGKPGSHYKLSVIIGGKEFTATSIMPQEVKFDTLFIMERNFLGKPRKIATVKYTDPADTYNAYRFTQYVDGFKENTIFLMDDKLSNGKTVTDELLIFEQMDGDDAREQQRRIDQYDNLTVEMRCIDKPNYMFWYSLSQSSLGSSQSASPGNPVTNIIGGALGTFSAHTVSSKSLVVE